MENDNVVNGLLRRCQEIADNLDVVQGRAVAMLRLRALTEKRK